jgi:RND family efflux transporter MFP subunit
VTTINVAFKVGGYVERVAKVKGVDGKPRWIQEGDEVREGMQLVALRKAEFKHRLAEARAGRAQAGAAARQARTELARTSTLASRNAIAGAERDAARTQLSSTSAGYGGAQARYDEARTALADATLVSPLDGIVLKRAIGEGELVVPGTLALVVADLSSVRAQFGVPDTMLARIAVGMPETVTTDAFPGEKFAGVITMIAPSADPRSRVFQVDVTIPNADGRLRTGSTAALVLDGERGAAAPLVPISAIVRSPLHADKLAVYVVETHASTAIVRAREIELDDYLGRDAPVKHGLEEHESSVVQGA